jgi:septum formation protein
MPPTSPPAAQALPLILASRSAARAALLTAAGVPFETLPAPVDEAAVKVAMLAEGAPPRDIADALAELKARRGAARIPEALVLGADQVLSCDGRVFDKPRDPPEARAQLAALRGRTHELHAAAVVYEAGRPVWNHVGRAQLTMRRFSDAFLDAYVEGQGEAVCDTVGAYRIEAGGAQLFARVEGDLFTVMGLPLLELLDFLRSRGVVAE